MAEVYITLQARRFWLFIGIERTSSAGRRAAVQNGSTKFFCCVTIGGTIIRNLKVDIVRLGGTVLRRLKMDIVSFGGTVIRRLHTTAENGHCFEN